MNPDVVYRSWGWQRQGYQGGWQARGKPTRVVGESTSVLSADDIGRLTEPAAVDVEPPKSAPTRDPLDKFKGSLAVWLDQNTISRADAFVPKDRLRDAYGQSCGDAGGPTREQFTKILRDLRPGVEVKQRRINGRRVEVFNGLVIVGKSD